MLKDFVKTKFLGKKPSFIHDNTFFLTIDIRALDQLSHQKANYINSTYTALELRIDNLMEEIKQQEILKILEILKEKISLIKFFVKIPIILTLRTELEVK